MIQHVSVTILQAMDTQKLNMTDLATKSGISVQRIGRLCRGKTRISSDVAQAIAPPLGLSGLQLMVDDATYRYEQYCFSNGYWHE